MPASGVLSDLELLLRSRYGPGEEGERRRVTTSSASTSSRETFSDGRELSQEALAREIRETRPLSVAMAERIRGMRAWADGRKVRAN